jgi:NarL family two-component system sensor histidine kinase YdfH
MMPVVIFVVIYVELYSRQMNANLRAQELLGELQAANQKLTEYANQVEDLTITTERQRMARELHDTLSQGLAGLILHLEAVDAHLEGGRPEKARSITQQAMDAARAILAASRRAIDDLRRAAPDDLETALRQEASRFGEAAGIPCVVDVSLPAALPPELREPILRIVAEALTNTAHHAQASRTSVSVTTTESRLHLEIRDDGCGFDPASVPPGHFGLVGMRERVRLAGGTLEIDSALGAGTKITISLPIGLTNGPTNEKRVNE